jgi:hypothetical protein
MARFYTLPTALPPGALLGRNRRRSIKGVVKADAEIGKPRGLAQGLPDG